MNSERHFLEKPSTLWITIVGIIITFAVSLAVLQGRVQASEDKTTSLKQDISNINTKMDVLLNKLNESAVNQAEIKVDVEYIKKAVIIVQDNQ